MRHVWTAIAGTALLAACAAQPPRPPSGAATPMVSTPGAVPAFAALPYEPFSRQDAVAIALREWRLFGGHINDEPEDPHRRVPPEDKPERWPGLWQRVGEYWWEGMEAGARESAWTGKHDGDGTEFPASRDGFHAWSAAFISYVMRIAAAGPLFPYSANHADYINAARTGTPLLRAERPEAYAPQSGDLICMGRGKAARLRFDDLPAPRFPAHCDIVVEAAAGLLTVIGGNVDDSVTMKHVPVDAAGHLATADGEVLDTRWPWFVVLRVLYLR